MQDTLSQPLSRKQERSVVTAESPCVGHCTTVLGDDVCRSCLRTFEEITHWVEMDDDQRCAVNQRIVILQTTGFPLRRE